MAAPGAAEGSQQVTLPGRPATDEDVPPHHGPPRLYRVLTDAWNQLWRALCGKNVDDEHIRSKKHMGNV
eukprot:703244-Lingulodinium_polyedra.AAC.1